MVPPATYRFASATMSGMTTGPSSPRSLTRVVALFAKQPRAGFVKSRLASLTTPDWAAQVADAFLRDTLARLARIDAQRVLAFAPDEAASDFEERAGNLFDLTPQGKGDLGERMADFFDAQLRRGVEAVVLLGSDSPTVPLEFVEQAFRELEGADLVLGPAFDGGYYLIGCARRVPPVFDGIAWGSSNVLGDTIARLEDASGKLALLPPWYDVDTLDDWRMLQGHVAALRRAGLDPGVPHTERLLQWPSP